MQLTGTQIAMIIIVVDFIILLISEILMKKHLTKKIMFPKTRLIKGSGVTNDDLDINNSVFLHMTDGIIAFDREGKIIYQFKVFGGMYAYLKEEILTEKNMIFEMHYTMIDDWKKIRPDIKTIYILPKNLEIAKQKVIERETNTEKLNERINEMEEHYNNICYKREWKNKFDYIVYNNYDNESEKQIIELVKKMLIEEQKGKIYAKNVF